MASNLRTADGGRYNASTVFINGILDRTALERVGLPRLTGSYAWSLTVGNAAVSSTYFCSIIAYPLDRSAHCTCHSLLAKRRLGIYQSFQDGRLRGPTSRRHAGQIQGSPHLVVLHHPDCRLRIWYHRYHNPEHHYASLVIHHRSVDWCFRCAFCKWRNPKSPKFSEFLFFRSLSTSADGSPRSSTPAMALGLLRTPS
jgi:hypothetical protein